VIKQIKVSNRFAMDMVVATRGFKFPYDHWYLISIYGGEKEFTTDKNIPILKDMGCVDMCSLNFWDITDKDYPKVAAHFPDVILFNKGHAKKIIDILNVAQKDIEDSVLVVHCSAGISRSGAVGTFACDFCNLDYNEFIKANPYIMANQHVLSLLRKVSGMTFSDEHSGIDLMGDHDGGIIF